jgi:hypothetical protein
MEVCRYCDQPIKYPELAENIGKEFEMLVHQTCMMEAESGG